MNVTISYVNNRHVLWCYGLPPTQHKVGSRHFIKRHNRNLADCEWEVIEHSNGEAYILPVSVVEAAKELGVTHLTRPMSVGEGGEDKAEMHYDSKGHGPTGFEIVRHGMTFGWIIAG